MNLKILSALDFAKQGNVLKCGLIVLGSVLIPNPILQYIAHRNLSKIFNSPKIQFSHLQNEDQINYHMG